MIKETKMGVPSIIRNVLKLKPKRTAFIELENGDFFELHGCICIKTDNSHAIDQDGFIISMIAEETVLPVKVKLEFDYYLLDEHGNEVVYL